jgi:hypothetical protein
MAGDRRGRRAGVVLAGAQGRAERRSNVGCVPVPWREGEVSMWDGIRDLCGGILVLLVIAAELAFLLAVIAIGIWCLEHLL